MSEPRVSVVIPAYGEPELLRVAVESALAQTLEDVEIVVVDDASPEPVASALDDLADRRLRLVRRAKNGGVGAARNTALAVTRAPIVAPLDADDSWMPDYLETIVPLFDDSAVGMVYTNGELHEPDGTVHPLHDSPDGHPLRSFDELAQGNVLRVPGTSFRRTALDAIGGYPPWLRHCQDWFVSLSLLRRGWRAAYSQKLLFRYEVPDYDTHWYGLVELERDELRLWLSLALRDPRLFGHPQLRWRVRRELERLARRPC